MYKIAVCDDEEAVAAQVKELITEWNPSVDVVCFSSGEELLENYQSYEAVFLDIDMAGMNGIETGKAIRKMDKDTKIVYLTAYRDYVSGAFGVHAFQYLLKPVNKKTIWNVLEEIFRYMKSAEKKIFIQWTELSAFLWNPYIFLNMKTEKSGL